MKKIIFSILGCVIVAFISLTFPVNCFGQPFYFPNKLYSDSNALYKALPNLAQQVITAYKDSSNSNYFKNAYHYQIEAGHYDKGLQFIDSARKYSEENPGSKMI